MVSLQYLSRSLFTACPGRLFSLSSFLVIRSPSGYTGGTSVVFKAVDVPCPGPFHFSHIADYIWFVSSTWPRCDTSFHFGLCGRKFVVCLFGQCQMLQEVQIMEEALMIPPAPRPNLETSRKPYSSQCVVTHPSCTRDHWIRYDICTV